MELLAFGDHGWGDEMLRATAMTVAVALASFALGLVLGMAGAAAKLSNSLILRTLGDVYTTLVRGIPELLIIYLLFFGGSLAIMAVMRGLFAYDGYVEIDSFTIGAVAVGVVSGAYSTEVIRGAVRAVPRGQIEAAIAMGMPPWLRLRRILIPQATRYALPGLGNVWQLTLKDTALISVTGLVEIMRQSHVAAGSTRQPFTFFLAAALLYLAITTISNWGFQRAELHASRGVRR
ncbi:ABC transporter permease [Marinivivus vitaminiproducens]|uniref:ABC transporter permease n=1 Tax=Marinivivus vitaminiproducens TaxID=3035935 RepID=UPI0027A9F44A|nr:ABC transporter permease [Geminicoccaceae bacterium SCSIO 64248]